MQYWTRRDCQKQCRVGEDCRAQWEWGNEFWAKWNEHSHQGRGWASVMDEARFRIRPKVVRWVRWQHLVQVWRFRRLDKVTCLKWNCQFWAMWGETWTQVDRIFRKCFQCRQPYFTLDPCKVGIITTPSWIILALLTLILAPIIVLVVFFDNFCCWFLCTFKDQPEQNRREDSNGGKLQDLVLLSVFIAVLLIGLPLALLLCHPICYYIGYLYMKDHREGKAKLEKLLV